MLTNNRPDHCDGTYDSYCDRSREYDNLGDIIGAADPELLDYMETYWKSNNGDDEGFWEHEWNKHGTCINTLNPPCYTNYTPQEEAVDYFQKTVDLFKSLDTYKASFASVVLFSSHYYRILTFFSFLHHCRFWQLPVSCHLEARLIPLLSFKLHYPRPLADTR